MRRLSTIAILHACFFVLGTALGTGQTATKRPFQVRDSIEMVRILDPLSSPNPASPILLARDVASSVSPDGAHAAILLGDGEIATNTNNYKLMIYEVSTLFTKPQPREVVRMAATSSRQGIVKVKWLADNRRIAFLGERAHELPQIWIVDSKTGALSQLTHHKTAVTDYDITPDASTWIYAVRPATDRDEPDYSAAGFVFRLPEQSPLDVLAEKYSPAISPDASEVYVEQAGRSSSVRVKQGLGRVLSVSIAPDGLHAVETLEVKAPPVEWKLYENSTLRQIMSGIGRGIYQYVLIDCTEASARPLLNAPNSTTVPALWTEDSHEVIVSQTFLPLSLPGAPQAGKNNVLSVSIDGNQVSIIRTGPVSSRWTPVDWQPHSAHLVLKLEQSGEYSVHTKTGDKWKRIDEGLDAKVRISVRQGLNDMPELEAQVWDGKRILRRSLISHLNPQLDGVSISQAKPFEWIGKDGLPWKALLYLPPGYDSSKRYPLVVQTHGYDDQVFEPDGHTTTAMATQALANSDMVVVQSWGPTDWAPRSLLMATQWMKGIEGLIDALDEQKLVNRRQIGLIGWSYTGWLVEYFITHSQYQIGAAVAADNADYGYLQYVLSANWSSVISEYDTLIYGGSPWEKPEVWLKESPAFNLQHCERSFAAGS